MKQMAENKSDEEKAKMMQAKYIEYQMIEQQLKQMQEQMEKFEQQIAEIQTIAEQLDELKNAKVGSETLVPIANGIFVKGKLLETDDVVVNVGAGVAVKKSVEDTKKLLHEQAAEIQNYKMQVAAQLEQMTGMGRKLEEELQKMVE